LRGGKECAANEMEAWYADCAFGGVSAVAINEIDFSVLRRINATLIG